MTAEDYRRAGVLFDQLRDVPEPERSAALDAACAGNSELRAQVLRLLAADREADHGSFLERRAIEDAARLLVPGPQLPAPGCVIGNYRLGARIGAGGMGVVYEGEDLRLHRRVAVKILPLPVGGDQADLVKRFQREARAASMLNHPNILSIFDADFDQGHYYIATEFVEGKTLGRLATEGRVERKLLLEIAIQLCSALGAAHEAGIVHRDIKPDNVMVRPDGIVKVLDFGLANRAEPDLRTRTGIVAGTPQYMAPEQVLGNPVGPPGDIFSAGVLLYQLATGRRPFDGPTEGAVLAAIVSQAPPRPSELGISLDPDLEALILRALEKDPDLRFQTANDMRSSLRLLQRGSQAVVSPVPQPRPLPRRRAWSAVLVAAAGGMAAMGLVWFAATVPPLPLPSRFERMTFGEGEKIYPNLSPDGKQFIYASPARGNWDIYLERAGGSAEIDLTADSKVDDTEPALSRDGTRIAFRSEREGGGLFVMEATGENPRRISARGHLPAWSPDGKSIVYCDDTFMMPNDRGAPGSHLHILDLADNRERELQTADAVQPNWSPHGQRIAYWGINVEGNREIFTVAADGGPPVEVTHNPAVDWNPVWSPSGRELYFISDRGGTMNLWRVRIDERTGRTSGTPEPVTTPAVYVRFLSWSADGSRFLYSQAQNRISLYSIAFDPSRLETSGAPVSAGGNYYVGNFSLSPDETQIVHDTLGDVHEDLWIVNVDGTGRRKLTSDSFRNRMPRWSPKGDEIMYISTRSGSFQEWMIRPDGSGLRQVTAATRSQVNTGVWIDGGRQIVASLFSAGLALVPPDAGAPIADPQMLPGLEKLNGLSYAFTSQPQNGLLLGHIAGNGENPIVMYSMAEGKLTRLGVRGTRPAWVAGSDNRFFLFLREDACYLYDRVRHSEKRLFSTGHEIYFMQLGSSGRRIYFTQTVRAADLWMGEMSR